jgi:NAD-dependent DNA ligase
MWNARKCASQKDKAELLGLVEGILSDGAVVEAEAAFLKQWIEAHIELRNQWPGSVLFARLEAMLEDGVLDPDEQRELIQRMTDFISMRAAAAEAADDAKLVFNLALPTVTLNSPFDAPPPKIEYVGRVFVVTGDFACAKRSHVVGRIESLGGDVASGISKKANFLVVGSLGCELWKTEGYGTKIEKAVELRNAGAPIRIVAEKHWFETLPA